MHESYRVSVEVLENGFAVEAPDMEAIAKKKAMAAKSKDASMPYTGDCTKKFAAKTIKDALRFVTAALEGIESKEYDSAFAEAGAKGSKK